MVGVVAAGAAATLNVAPARRPAQPAGRRHDGSQGSLFEDGVLVGDPGIEPGMGYPGGVTVRCRTLQHVPRACIRPPSGRIPEWRPG